jgi:hypothetical protein
MFTAQSQPENHTSFGSTLVLMNLHTALQTGAYPTKLLTFPLFFPTAFIAMLVALPLHFWQLSCVWSIGLGNFGAAKFP